MATRLQRTQGTATSTKKFTFSAWIKKSSNVTGNDQVIYDSNNDANNRITVYFRGSTNNTLNIYSASGGSQIIFLETTRLFRDLSSWYHIVLAFDTTQGTAADRVKVYVNGTQETAFNSPAYPNQDVDLPTGTSSYVHSIGYYTHGGSSAFDGYMTHPTFCDGTALTPTSFGFTDTTSGIWKFKPPSGFTFGNNGFHLKFENSGNIGLDSSGEGNNFTVSTGTAVQVLDTPSNVTCTLNPLAIGSSAPTFSIGATRVVATATSYQFSCGTFAIPLNGKWYWEVKADNNVNGSNSEYLIGAVLESRLQASSNFAEFASDGITQYGSVSPNIGANDIISVAVDRTAATLKIYKNDSLILTKTSLPTELIFPMVTVFGSGVNAYSNFGNGYFGTTAVSSPGTNASNLGIFEFDVPTGYTALCTKGLNE